jgi:SWIM/SEC-C metal-binding protein
MAKLGSKEKPAIVHVQTMERAEEIMALCNEKNWQVIVGIESDKDEDITDVETLLKPPKSVRSTVTIGRNDLCFCGSGKKYKNCCLN